MATQYEAEHSSIGENNAPLGWFLLLIIGAVAILSLTYGALFLHSDPISQDHPSTTVPHGRTPPK